MRRHLVFPIDFDTRAHLLEEPGETWEERPRKLHLENRNRLIEGLRHELGPVNFEMKLQDFRDAGHGPFSIVSYHNALYHQVRYAFIHGFYYPALVSGCALGERIINHLIIDLREDYRATPEYKSVYRKNSFDDWERAIATLEAWGVFLKPDVASALRQLKQLRHKSVHFDPDTYKNLRNDALSALRNLGAVIFAQFGFASGQDCMIDGMRGAFFIKKKFESHPFIKKFYLPQCPLVGPYYAVSFTKAGTLFYDRANYVDQEVTDEEFAEIFNARTSEMVVPTEDPPGEGIVVVARIRR